MGGHCETLGDSSLFVNVGQFEVIKLIITSVMANFDCQLVYIWNQLKPNQLGTTVKDSPGCIICIQRFSLNPGHTFWWQPTLKDMEEGQFINTL